MAFSGLLSAANHRSSKARHSGSPPPSLRRHVSSSSSSSDTSVHSTRSNKSTRSSATFISDESHLPPLAPDAPDLRELNNCLEALAAIFPDIQVQVFREMLVNFSGESRLAVVADELLKNRVGWVNGRWRSAADRTKTGPGTCDGAGCHLPNAPDRPPEADAQAAPGRACLVPAMEAFRSEEYKDAAKKLAWHEFRGLPRSTITAVLAESNYSYLEARQTLVLLSSKSWRFTLSSIFYRRKPVTSTGAANHPLVVWKSSGRGSIIPTIKSTGNAELDRELFRELIVPLKASARTTLEETDRAMALAMNSEEAETHQQLYECCCCFTNATFEELTSCNTKGHLICIRCVQLSIGEAVFGQGWVKTIDKQSGTLRCPAVPLAGANDGDDCGWAECDGHIPYDQMHRAMREERRGAQIMLKLEQRLADHDLVASGLPLVRCPFCDYAEVDEIWLPRDCAKVRLKTDNLVNILCAAICILFTPLLVLLAALSSLVTLLVSSRETLGDRILHEFMASLARHRRRQRGLRFVCASPTCGRKSCMSCGKEWVDVHICHESSLVALRTQVEQAMSMAIKRVCPKCNASFVKQSGCNKMTCNCGYKMCYVCRKDISGTEGDDAGYRHFCQHFRPQGDGRPCKLCNRCNLWENEDTDVVLRKAKEEAVRKWRQVEKRELSGAEVNFLETGVSVTTKKRGADICLFRGKLPTMADVCDVIVENVVA